MVAKFEVTGARQELGFTPTRAVRANIDVRTADVGAAIGQGAVQLASQAIQKKKREDEGRRRIEEKRRQMQDANSAVVATKLRDTATVEFGTFKLTNPQETWEAFRTKQAGDVATKIGELDFSPDAAETQRVKSEAYTSVETAKSLTQATRQLRTDTIAAQTESMVDAFRSGDITKIAEASRRFSDNGANMGKDKAEVLSDIKAAKEAGETLRKQDTIDGWKNRISEKPVETAEILSNELEARKEDKGIISEDELSSKDMQSLLNTATNRQTQLVAEAQAARNQKQKDLENGFYSELSAPDANTTEIMARVQASDLDATAKGRLDDDEADFANKDIRNSWPLTDDDAAVTALNSQLLEMKSGKFDITEVNEAINKFAVDNKLTKGSRDKFRAKAEKGGLDSIDESVDNFTVRVKNALVGRLTDRAARLKAREAAGVITKREVIEARDVGFQLQVGKEQLSRYNAELDTRLRELGTDTVSGTEATAIASEVWERFRDKTFAQQIIEFKEFSGGRIPMPDKFPNDVWLKATNVQKANIVEARKNGLNDKQILEIINR